MIIKMKPRSETVKIRILLIINILCIVFIISACDNKKTQPIGMVAVPQLEFISDKSIGSETSKKIHLSIESFYCSNEITNKEFREFTDWVKNNPDKMLGIRRERSIKVKDPETGIIREYTYTFPKIIWMSDLLPKLIDSSALFRLDKRFKNYFTDKKYDDYPVVGVSRNVAEFFCDWKTNFEVVITKVRKGKYIIYTARSPDTEFRLPLEIEWEYVAKQPLISKKVNNQLISKVNEGSTNMWGISHLNDNVSEWVIASEDTLAISRGDSWKTNMNTSDRLRFNPDSSNGYTGFRIIRTYTPIQINKKSEK